MPDDDSPAPAPIVRTRLEPAGRRRRNSSGERQTERTLATGDPRTRMTSASLHWLTAGMALLAALIFVLTDADGGRSSSSVSIQLFFEFGLTLGLTVFARRKMQGLREAPLIMPLLILVVIASLVWEPLQRTFLLSGRPFEMMIMHSQKNLMLGAAIFGCWVGYQRLSIAIGVALAIFCAAITRESRVHWLIAVYGFAAVSWMIGSYWDTLQSRLISGETRRVPLRWLLIGPSIPLLMLLATATGGQSVITSLRGFLPSSGGDGEADDFSRGGVNDGNALVAGTDNIKSFGPIEDAPFAEDDKPSLYDVFNDSFDEPVRKLKDQDRAIGLPPELLADVKARMARSEQAGREFSTLRRNTKPDQKKIRDLDSKALFYVAGRVPLHLRMEVYDVFDGIDWIPENLSELQLGMAITMTNGRPWLRVPCGGRGLEVHSGMDSHALKIISLRSPVIPAPLDLRSVHIDKVDQADMFGWYRDTIVQMNRKTLPDLTTIHLKSECMDHSRLLNHDGLSFLPHSDAKRLQLPQQTEMESIRALAEEWTRGIQGKYAQVDAICRRLKSDYTLDRTAVVPESSTFPVGDFLFVSKRGPEYQFATAATLMLRSLGFSTRAVSGFYASPERYDARKQHTAVHSSDVHFWCEVYLGSGTWATVEPSPGYEILGPPPGLWKRILLSAKVAATWMLAHWILVAGTSAAVLITYRRRRVLLDFVSTLVWNLAPARTARGRVLQTVRLMDLRLRCSGRQRPRHVTLSRWLRQQSDLKLLSPAISEFAQLADWAAFGESSAVNVPDTQKTEACCQSIRRELTLTRCREGFSGSN
jgi:protein-glutamine gamma-glutamyltransferase